MFGKKPISHDQRRAEVAETIVQFCDGTCGPWDWDDFTSIRIKDDPMLEEIRLKCIAVREVYPPKSLTEYCNEEGEQVLRSLAQHLLHGVGE